MFVPESYLFCDSCVYAELWRVEINNDIIHVDVKNMIMMSQTSKFEYEWRVIQ